MVRAGLSPAAVTTAWYGRAFRGQNRQATPYPSMLPFEVRLPLQRLLLARASAPFMVELFASRCFHLPHREMYSPGTRASSAARHDTSQHRGSPRQPRLHEPRTLSSSLRPLPPGGIHTHSTTTTLGGCFYEQPNRGRFTVAPTPQTSWGRMLGLFFLGPTSRSAAPDVSLTSLRGRRWYSSARSTWTTREGYSSKPPSLWTSASRRIQRYEAGNNGG